MIGFFLIIIGVLLSIQAFDAVTTSPMPMFKILTDACDKDGGLVLTIRSPHR